MLNLKLVPVAFFFLFVTIVDHASAQGRRGPRYNPRPDDYHSRGRVTCTASDRGWEEHWGGHGSCGECVQRHGDCVESCYEVRHICEAQGSDFQGRIRTFTVRAPDRWTAEREAIRQCEWDRSMRSCAITSCREERLQVSHRSCR